MKKCNHCKQTKPLEDFYRMTKASDGRQYKCKACVSEIEKTRKDYHKKKMKRLRANPEYRRNEAANKRDYRLQYWYGITEADYLKILEEQNHQCKICGVHDLDCPRPLAVDHNHKTKQIRGLLCDSCNRGLGLFKDNPDILTNALEYLKTQGHYGTTS